MKERPQETHRIVAPAAGQSARPFEGATLPCRDEGQRQKRQLAEFSPRSGPG